MQVIQESYIPLESGDREEHFKLSVIKTASRINERHQNFQIIALKWEFSNAVSRPKSTSSPPPLQYGIPGAAAAGFVLLPMPPRHDAADTDRDNADFQG